MSADKDFRASPRKPRPWAIVSAGSLVSGPMLSGEAGKTSGGSATVPLRRLLGHLRDLPGPRRPLRAQDDDAVHLRSDLAAANNVPDLARPASGSTICPWSLSSRWARAAAAWTWAACSDDCAPLLQAKGCAFASILSRGSLLLVVEGRHPRYPLSMGYPKHRDGPFLVSQLREGDPYELSDGHPIQCLPSGPRGGSSTVRGGAVLDTDPAAPMAGSDIGFELGPRTMRAPDLAVGTFADDTKGFVRAVPALAVEYADSGQDEAELLVKIEQLFDAGTRWVWVVRLMGRKHVDVFEPGQPVRRVDAGGLLDAPGVLANAVLAESLWDRAAAHEATLRNLLQRKGYASLEAVRAEGRDGGREEGRDEGRDEGLRAALFAVLAARALPIDEVRTALVTTTRDRILLARWVARAAVAGSVEEVFGEEG